MKKIVFILAILLLLLSVSSCGVRTVEDACEKADEMLVKWSKERLGDCSYEGEYYKIEGVYHYVVTAKIKYSLSHPEIKVLDNPEYVIVAYMNDRRDTIKNTAYNELDKLFEKFDVPVVVAIADCDGKPYYLIYNGEITPV